MIKLSVNINKIATLRNARGGNNPDVLQVAIDCQNFGADGITVHPRPDERHIRFSDVEALRKVVNTEFNIEGYPNEQFMDLVLRVKPEQVTLVPDSPEVITSNNGWDTVNHNVYLKEIIKILKREGIRTSIFLNPDSDMVYAAKETETDRIELYTEYYARTFPLIPELAITGYVEAAVIAQKLGLGLNAGHDLDAYNLNFFKKNIPNLLEVSIGHALIADSLYIGLHNSIQLYKSKLL